MTDHDRVREELEALRKFWRLLWVRMDDCLDFDDVRDAAEVAGLIELRPHAQPCALESCDCDGATEMYFETALGEPEGGAMSDGTKVCDHCGRPALRAGFAVRCAKCGGLPCFFCKACPGASGVGHPEYLTWA